MEENNKIIAEFMGFTFEKNIGYYDNEMLLEQIVYEQQNGNCFDELLFNKDWNWLMKVVEKIEKEFCSTNIHYYSQKQMYSVEFLGFNIEYDNSEYGDDKMKILYDSCVKFINFYNKQKEE